MVYDLLEELGQMHLVSTSFFGHVKIFSAESPESVVLELKRKLSRAELVMPIRKVKVKFYEGAEGIKSVCEDILSVKAGEYHYFGSLREMFEVTGREYQDYYVKRRIKRGIWSNAIRFRGKEVNDEFMRGAEKNLRRVRFFPEEISEDVVSLFIYDDKIAIHSGVKENYAMIIESRELSTLMRVVWHCTWASCRD